MTRNASYARLLFWYVLFGAIHEISHCLIALVMMANRVGAVDTVLSEIARLDDSWWVLAKLLLGRQTPILLDLQWHEHEVARHAGWIISFCWAGLLLAKDSHQYKALRLAAVLTAVEAVTTDLFGLPVIPLLPVSCRSFFCGNFGIILLHQAWWKDGGTSAMDVLEKMVQVTMMRGAQSGGVVAFESQGFRRTRVVNKKRTSLAKLLRDKVQRRVNFRHLPGNTAAFSGHTRFATTSKATLDGTHPQQWTPCTSRSVFFKDNIDGGPGSFKSVPVENYITHNGDFEFFRFRSKNYDLLAVQSFLSEVTGVETPAAVDSCAVAGMVDVLRTKDCFSLSCRYALAFALSTSTMTIETGRFPSQNHFEVIGKVFEAALSEMLVQVPMEVIETERQSLGRRVVCLLEARSEELIKPLDPYITDDEEGGASIFAFCLATIGAFFDNDLFKTTKTFLQNAKGSFGLCFTSSLDAQKQLCLAARGQTMSVAFYPRKGLICYASEQAAVKAGIAIDFPGHEPDKSLGRSRGEVDNDALRLDLDDLGGEIILLDWSKSQDPTTKTIERIDPDSRAYDLMNGRVTAVLYHQNKIVVQNNEIYHRMTRLTRNRFIRPLKAEPEDVILSDLQEIPKACQNIQDEFHVEKACTSLNRLTAFHLMRCLRQRLEAHIAGTVPNHAIDILLTGCEVSLWVAEQFASDLQKVFPRLRIKVISSNKVLGLFGQEISIPSLGFPYSAKHDSMHEAIVIIVSHSGGTFAPLACSSLLQSATKNIFVVTSEWDTQIGKQLRSIDPEEDHPFVSRIFSTEVGMRPAEPCSISVAATHQLLTNLFGYICGVVLSDKRFRITTGAIISEQDLQILEKCNQCNIRALADIVGVEQNGDLRDCTESKLREVGNLWADHILENAKAYMLSFVYIFATVCSGYPLFYGIAILTGFDKSSSFVYLIRFLDAAMYFWLPQINITLLRLVQGRNVLHRMVGRTVVIGDIPWVAQSAEAFLSKIFAVSYSIAGVNVLSGNPVDHFVHRHTHRVVRGTLLVCGRPDGRLSALSTAEAAVCLSVSQASSIQSLGGTCESVTIGHNPFKLSLTKNDIILKRKRPLFLCERLLVETDAKEEKREGPSHTQDSAGSASNRIVSQGSAVWETIKSCALRCLPFWLRAADTSLDQSRSPSLHDPSVRPKNLKYRSASALLGAYTSMDEHSSHACNPAEKKENFNDDNDVDHIVTEAIQGRKFSDEAHRLFQAFDLDGDGILGEEEFVEVAKKLHTEMSEEELRALFKLHDVNGSAAMDYHEFLELVKKSGLGWDIRLPPSNRDERGMIRIQASEEKYFGESIRKYNAGKAKNDLDFKLAASQHLVQELYDTRIASMQRFVAMTVIFHQMGRRVQDFFARISFGWLGYRMDRTHSIMRIATTASPVSGADVKERMRRLQVLKNVHHAVHVISVAYLRYRAKKKEVTLVKSEEVEATETEMVAN